MSDLSTWTKKIEESELPILQYTATSIMHKVDRDDTSAGHLAKIILRDSSLTARLLRLSNSVIINPNKVPVSTINRAVLFLGFDMIRSLCLSLSLIDTLLKSKSQEHVKKLMARSFSCAVMARELAEQRGDKAPEEVFVAALLSSIGEMAFWCVAEDKGEEVFQFVEEKGCTVEQAQKEILGFTFDDLTVVLTSGLSVGGMLKKSFSGAKASNPRIKEIQLGKKFAESFNYDGEGENNQRVIMEIAQHLKQDESCTRKIIREQLQVARDTVKEYGANDIATYLPGPEPSLGEEVDQSGQLVVETAAAQIIFPETDPALQMSVLKDLSKALAGNPSPNIILQIVLEGINRGVGLDRGLFALMTIDKKALVGKFGLGHNSQELTDRFRFLLEPGTLFSKVLEAGQAVWVDENNTDEYSRLVHTGLLNILESKSFLVYPIVINRKPIGILYADRMPSQREISGEHFVDFKYFGQQACLAIEQLSSR